MFKTSPTIPKYKYEYIAYICSDDKIGGQYLPIEIDVHGLEEDNNIIYSHWTPIGLDEHDVPVEVADMIDDIIDNNQDAIIDLLWNTDNIYQYDALDIDYHGE